MWTQSQIRLLDMVFFSLIYPFTFTSVSLSVSVVVCHPQPIRIMVLHVCRLGCWGCCLFRVGRSVSLA
jgi:hypothetical protein